MNDWEMRARVADVDPWRAFGEWEDDDVRSYLARWIDDRQRWDFPQGGTAYGVARQADPEEDIADLAEKHFVGFCVLDGNGDPYPDVEYALRNPDGECESGKVGSTGEVRKDDVDSADWTLNLRSVADVKWSEAGATSGDARVISALVEGYEDGEAVEVRLFCELAETDDDVLETLTGEVVGGAVTVPWTYEHDRDGPFARRAGVVRIIAEVRIGADGPWAKSLEPLALTLPGIDSARWSVDAIAPGEPVGLEVRTSGVPDGTPLTIEVFSRRRDGTQVHEAIFEEVVEAGAIDVDWTFPAPPANRGQRGESECIFIATLDGDDFRVTVSNTLWVTRIAAASKSA